MTASFQVRLCHPAELPAQCKGWCSIEQDVFALQIPYEDGVSFHEQVAKSNLVLVDGADHNFSKQPHADILITHTVHFLTTGTVAEETKA